MPLVYQLLQETRENERLGSAEKKTVETSEMSDRVLSGRLYLKEFV